MSSSSSIKIFSPASLEAKLVAGKVTKNQENVDIDVTPPVQALIGEDVDTAGMVTKFQENVDIDVIPPAQALIGEDVDTAGKVTKNQENVDVDVTPPAQALIGGVLPELNAWKRRKCR